MTPAGTDPDETTVRDPGGGDQRRVLVAGVGNVFLSDDGFGVEVARRLAAQAGALPPGVEVADMGIRGVHLAYRLLDGYHALVLVDTTHRDGPPGTLYVLEHDLDGPREPAALDGHSMSPDAVLALLEELSRVVGRTRPVQRVVVVGCEPADLSEGMGLSSPVSDAVDEAVRTVIDVLDDLLPG